MSYVANPRFCPVHQQEEWFVMSGLNELFSCGPGEEGRLAAERVAEDLKQGRPLRETGKDRRQGVDRRRSNQWIDCGWSPSKGGETS